MRGGNKQNIWLKSNIFECIIKTMMTVLIEAMRDMILQLDNCK